MRSFLFITISLLLCPSLMAAEYSYFGLCFQLDDEGVTTYSNSNEVLRLSSHGVSISFVTKDGLHLVVETEGRNSISLNPGLAIPPDHWLSSYPSSTLYQSRKKRRSNPYTSAALIIDYSPQLYLIYHFESNYQIEEKLTRCNEIISNTSLCPKTENVLLKDSSTLKLESFTQNGSEYFNSRSGSTGPRLRNGLDGQLVMIWSDINQKHRISILNERGELESERLFGDTAVYDLIVHDDGITYLLSPPLYNEKATYSRGVRHHHLFLVKEDHSGREVFRTHLMGIDEIKKTEDQRFAFWGQQSTRLAWSGTYYAAHFATYRKWSDGLTHQADAFLVLNAHGDLMDEDSLIRDNSCTWCVSHSFSHEMIYDGEKFTRFSLGDAYPRAIQMTRTYPESVDSPWTGTRHQFSKFPGETGDNYVYDVNFGSIASAGDHLYFSFDSELNNGGMSISKYGNKRCNDLYLFNYNRSKDQQSVIRLSSSKNLEERLSSVVALDSHRLLIKYQVYNPRTRGVGLSNTSGSVWEVIGVYNTKQQKWVNRSKLLIQLDGKTIGRFGLNEQANNYFPYSGWSGSHYLSSQLFKDKTGNIWFVRFHVQGNGFELIKVELREN